MFKLGGDELGLRVFLDPWSKESRGRDGVMASKIDI